MFVCPHGNIVGTTGSRTLLHSPPQNVDQYSTEIKNSVSHPMHLMDDVIEFFVGLANTHLSDSGQRTLMFGTHFLPNLHLAISNDNLQDAPSVFNKAEACISKYGFKKDGEKLKFKDIEKIIIIAHHAGKNRDGLRKSTRLTTKQSKLQSGKSSNSFTVVTGHYYVMQLYMTPTVRGKLKLEEFDSANGGNTTRLSSVSRDLLTFVTTKFKVYGVSFTELSLDGLRICTVIRVCPQQVDWWSCGIYSIKNAADLARYNSVSLSVDVRLIRNKLMACLMTHRRTRSKTQELDIPGEGNLYYFSHCHFTVSLVTRSNN